MEQEQLEFRMLSFGALLYGAIFTVALGWLGVVWNVHWLTLAALAIAGLSYLSFLVQIMLPNRWLAGMVAFCLILVIIAVAGGAWLTLVLVN